jgi:glycosyltransferase involved in cell wall biosynthesis
MSPKTIKRVCLTPQVSGVGGMVSFSAKLTNGLAKKGIQTTFDLSDEQIDAVLVIGGTRQLVALRRITRRGIPIVQRLDGINWLHRHLRTGARHWLRAEIGNWLLAYIRERIATKIVYQSHFVQNWWERIYGPGPGKKRVIHNGVDLDLFQPGKADQPPTDRVSILMVEGNLDGGYELGIQSAVALAEGFQTEKRSAELIIAGQVDAKLSAKWDQKSRLNIAWVGVLPNEQLPQLYRKAHLLFSGDLNAACPNSVIEAMACGLPVLAFNTGALSELVPEGAGKVVPYGGDPWKLDTPDTAALVGGGTEILKDQRSFRAAARAHAEQEFSLDRMVDAYIGALSG